VDDIAGALPSFVSWLDGETPDPEDEESAYLDVRLQVWENGSWTLHTGDSQYDQDGRGFWGCGSYAAGDEMLPLAYHLREDALEHAWSSGAMEGEPELEDVPSTSTASADEAFGGKL
jgi:hypothetical protein